MCTIRIQEILSRFAAIIFRFASYIIWVRINLPFDLLRLSFHQHAVRQHVCWPYDIVHMVGWVNSTSWINVESALEIDNSIIVVRNIIAWRVFSIYSYAQIFQSIMLIHVDCIYYLFILECTYSISCKYTEHLKHHYSADLRVSDDNRTSSIATSC